MKELLPSTGGMLALLFGVVCTVTVLVIAIKKGREKGWFRFRRQGNTQDQAGGAVVQGSGLGGIRLSAGTPIAAILWLIWIAFLLMILASVVSAFKSCVRAPFEMAVTLKENFAAMTGKREDDAPHEKEESPLSKYAVLTWLKEEARPVPSDNGWERVLTEGTHSSLGKYGCEFITNCSLLGDCVIELAPLDGQTELSSHERLICYSRSFFLDQEKRSIKEINEYSSDTQRIKVQGAQLLYLWRRPSERYLREDIPPLRFKWRLIENRSKKVVRRAFKRDFQPQGGYKESCDFTILPFQLLGSDGSTIRTQFDLSVTFTRILANEARPTVDTPEPNQELLEDLPSVIRMVTVVKDKKDEREIFSYPVVENTCRISSEEIRERWLNPDEYKLGKIVVVIRQPLRVHIAYCVRGERW